MLLRISKPKAAVDLTMPEKKLRNHAHRKEFFTTPQNSKMWKQKAKLGILSLKISSNILAKIKTSISNPDPVQYLIQLALLITWSKSNMARIYNAGLRSVENEIWFTF